MSLEEPRGEIRWLNVTVKRHLDYCLMFFEKQKSGEGFS